MSRSAWAVGVGLATSVVFALAMRAGELVRLSVLGKSPDQVVGAALAALREVPGAIIRHPLHVSLHTTDITVGAVAAALLLLGVLYQVGGKGKRRPGEEQGSAGWGGPRDIAPFTSKEPSRRLQLTATEALAIDTYRTRRNLNVLVLGGSGTGKTRSYVMPNLARVDMSVAVTDPKGEILREVGPLLNQRGYDVRVFNLIDLTASDHFNPFAYFDSENPETSIVQLVECIITNTSGTEAAAGDQFWERAERALLSALCAVCWATVTDETERDATLVDVLDLQKKMAAWEGASPEAKSEVDEAMENYRAVVTQWREAPSGNPQEELIINVLDFATRQYRTFEQGAGITKQSIIISLGVRLAPLDMHAVRTIVSDDTIEIDQLGERPMALFRGWDAVAVVGDQPNAQ